MKRERRTYCRYCYARIEGYRGASIPCPGCGQVHLRVNEEKYWTLETPLRDLERLAKGASIALVIGLGVWLWIRAQAKVSLGMGQGYAIGAPIVVLMILWMTASKITHRHTYFRAGLLWSILLPLTGVALVGMGVGGLTANDRAPFGTVVSVVLLSFGAPFLLVGPFAFKTTRWHRDWKARYLAERLHDVADDADGD